MVIKRDFLSGLDFIEIVSGAARSAPLSLPQLPKRIPCVGSAAGVCSGAVSMGAAAMPVDPEASAAASLESSLSSLGASLAFICSFQRWKSS
jgi:hypothetical protein